MFALKKNEGGKQMLYLNENPIDEAGVRKMFASGTTPTKTSRFHSRPIGTSIRRGHEGRRYVGVAWTQETCSRHAARRATISRSMSADHEFRCAVRLAGGDFAWIADGAAVRLRQSAAATRRDRAPAAAADAWSLCAIRLAVSVVLAHSPQRIAGWRRLSRRVTLPEDDAPADLLGKLVVSTPPWFISLIVHFSIMILLGLLVLGANALRAGRRADRGRSVAEARRQRRSTPRRSASSSRTHPMKFSSEGLEPSKDPVAALSAAILPQVDHPLVGPPVLEPTPGGTHAGRNRADARDRARVFRPRGRGRRRRC